MTAQPPDGQAAETTGARIVVPSGARIGAEAAAAMACLNSAAL